MTELKQHPIKPQYAYDGDVVLVSADENGDNPAALAVLSLRPKRGLIPGDQSSAVARATWIGQVGAKIRGDQRIETIYTDAVLWDGVWYIQYREVESK